MHHQPLVSIIIPCFNNEAYVAEAIDSALAQAYGNIEVIVIDDGSTDSSLDIIRSYARRIVWRIGPNEGACRARNKGLALARGEFVKFLDADDLLASEGIEFQVRQASVHTSDRDVVVGDHLLIDQPGNVLPGRQYVHSVSKGETFGFDDLFMHGPLVSEPLHRASLLREVGGFRNCVRRGQEHDLHLRMFFHGVSFRYESALCFYYRAHQSETRLSIASRGKGYLAKPEALFEIMDALEQHSGAVPHQTRAMVAKRAWRYGRDLLRSGDVAQAEQLFRAALEICPDDHLVGSPFYKWLCGWGGPALSEEIGRFSRPFRRAK